MPPSMLMLTKRLAPTSPQNLLTRYTSSACPSRWRLLALPRTTALCRYQSTASAQVAAYGSESSSAVVTGIKNGNEKASTRLKKQKKQASMDVRETPRHKDTVPRQDPKAKGNQKSKSKAKAKAGATPRRTPKSRSKNDPRIEDNREGRRRKAREQLPKLPKLPKRRDLTISEVKQLTECRRRIHDFFARSLTIPIYEYTHEKRQFTVRISDTAGKLQAIGTGAAWQAELEASIKFEEGIKENVADISVPSDGTLNLNTSNAEQYVRYYAKRYRSGMIEEKIEGAFPDAYSSQVIYDGKPLGTPVIARNKKEAMAISWLTAAVDLAQQNPSIFHKWQHAERGNDGQILSLIRPIDFHVLSDMLSDMEASSSTFLRSQSTKNKRKPSAERSWEYAAHSRHSTRANADVRSAKLLQRYEAFMANPDLSQLRFLKDNLPMNQRRDEVLQLVKNNTFSIVVGATGSGKTTQVPQIILEDAILEKRGADIDIICTQPRRIAAKSVAQRVALERNESLGDTVGYQVKGEKTVSDESGRMTYCTTGVLLKQLQNDPQHVMDTASHIIIDEVHERDLLVDFLMITLKKTIEERLRLNQRVPNVVLMSATMDTELFANYFKQKGADGVLGPCPSISIPGRTFPVQEKYLDNILAELRGAYTKSDLRILENPDTKDYLLEEASTALATSSRADWQSPPVDTTDIRAMKDAIVPVSLVAATIAHITQTTTEGAILAFLPGLADIVSTEKLLLQNPLGVDFSDTNRFRIFMLHSSIKENQDDIFEPVPEGCRKIIISTNIAETSVTIPDVQHVVDSGKLREKRYNQLVQITKLQCVWVSKSNMRQRAGRAGRVQNGNYYALYPKSRYESLETIGLPEMLRSDLMEVCLDVKAHSNYNIAEFLADSIQPPNPAAVNASLQDLKEIDAITATEELTPLGKLLASLPVHPSLGKMIVLGVIFRCLDPLLILGASANERSLFARPPSAASMADREKENFGRGLYSDPLTTINAFREARHYVNTSGRRQDMGTPPFFMKTFLHHGAFRGIDRTMREIEALLRNVGVTPKISGREWQDQCGGEALNRNSNNATLIRALILAGQRGNLAVSLGPLCSTQTESRAMIHRSSLNHFLSPRRRREGNTARSESDGLPSPPILSFGGRHLNDQNDITLRDTTLISPLIAMLFGKEIKTNRNVVTIDDRFQFFVVSDGQKSAWTAVRDLENFRKGIDELFANALLDLAEQKTLADDPFRDQFASAVAHILDQDFKLYMAKAARGSAYPLDSQEKNQERGMLRLRFDRPKR